MAAVSLAVETSYPEVRSVIELGGQDAKIIIFHEGSVQGHRKKIASMNDKCAGGTSVVIEKIAAKLHIPTENLVTQRYEGLQLFPIAGKCDVFAETDITGLQKQGVPGDRLMASLFRTIVLQNLSVLTRGHTLLPKVFLLGGPNAHFPGLQSAWRRGLLDLWKRKNIAVPEGASLEDLVVVPPVAEYFAAIGAIEFGAAEDESIAQYEGTQALESYIARNEASTDQASGMVGCHDARKHGSAHRAIFREPQRARVHGAVLSTSCGAIRKAIEESWRIRSPDARVADRTASALV